MSVAALFVREDSVYHYIPGVDAFAATRNALSFKGGCPVVAHPPCRAWAGLRAFARPSPGERWLTRWALLQVRTWGGVLEHPARSLLLQDAGFPRPGAVDAWGGWSMCVDQHWWGHPAQKRTLLYFAGIVPAQLPSYAPSFTYPTHIVGSSRGRGCLPEVSKAGREHTPLRLARWLVAAASVAVPPVVLTLSNMTRS